MTATETGAGGEAIDGDARAFVLPASFFQTLLDALTARGYRVLGPTVRDAVVVYEDLARSEELPIGTGDQQSGGHYRLVERGDGRMFGFVVGPGSWKQFLFPSKRTLWSGTRDGKDFQISIEEDTSPPLALVGVRACELAAIAAQDRILIQDRFIDPVYAGRRQRAFLVAVDCEFPASTCFCGSMGTGPGVRDRAGLDDFAHHSEVPQAAFDLALTELYSEERHVFLVRIGSREGREVVRELPVEKATSDDFARAQAVVDAAAGRLGAPLEAEDVRKLLKSKPNHSRWKETGKRCLSCTNCTMVCPTCFCVNIEDVTSLSGDRVERTQSWDSCFTLDFSYIHGGSVRLSAGARYRHWITHKLATWHDQFGMSGCVGCGRCITWCPVGIDLREEVEAVQTHVSKTPEEPDE